MSASNEPQAFEPQAPYLGHPFGGLLRDDRFGRIGGVPSIGASSDADAKPAADDAGGFDFHLGVYSRF
jgi:hypothetical protein